MPDRNIFLSSPKLDFIIISTKWFDQMTLETEQLCVGIVYIYFLHLNAQSVCKIGAILI